MGLGAPRTAAEAMGACGEDSRENRALVHLFHCDSRRAEAARFPCRRHRAAV
jgi:hypothetical protein